MSSPSSPLVVLSSTSSSSESDAEVTTSNDFPLLISTLSAPKLNSALAVLSGHVGSVCSLAVCGEFVLSASQSKDIIVWQHPDLRQFAKFGDGDGSVKALVAVGNKVFTAHQDSKIRMWKVSRRCEKIFRLTATLPTTKDYLGKFMNQKNYVQTRRHHRKLWIEHNDTISCLAVQDGLVYSGSWDKTIKVWRIKDLKCLESIKAHDDAINALAVVDSNSNSSVIYSASADGTIKIWETTEKGSHRLEATLKCDKEISWNAITLQDVGRLVFAGGSDGRVMGWETKGLGLVCEVKAHEKAVLCVCSVGEFICCGSADNTISIWKLKDGSGLIERIGVLRGHEGPVKCLQASNCGVGGGFVLYSGGLDKTLRVWWVAKDCGA